MSWQKLIILALIITAFVFIQLGSTGIIGGDGYYHIRYAKILRLAFPRLSIPFPFLPLTILNPKDFTNHHLLFHILLMPFTFGNLIVGAKIAAVIFATTATLIWFLIAKAQGVKFIYFWLLVFFASSSDFLFRLSMTRRQSLVLALLLLAVYLILTRRFKWLLALGFCFAWLFDGWIMLVAVCLISSIALWIEQKKIDLKVFLAPLIGLLLGIIINPFFPHNLIFSINHLLPKINQQANYLLRLVFERLHLPLKILVENNPIPLLRVGTEWYPYTKEDLLRYSGFALVMVALALLLSLRSIFLKKRVEASWIAWGGCAIFFTILMLLSSRFDEYQPAFATIFAAITFSSYIKKEQIVRIFTPLKRVLKPLIIIIVLVIGIFNLIDARTLVANEDNIPEKFAAASYWLEKNSPPGALIFTNDWDQFPRLFFYNTKNTYLVGLDPYYLYQYDPNLYLSWQAITQGEVENPSQKIANQFKSNWVFIDERSSKFLEQAQKDPRMAQVYQDKWATIFKIN